MRTIDHARSRLKLLLAEDSLPVRQAMRAAFQGIPGVRVIGEADDAGNTIDLVQKLAPDVVTLDVRLKDSFGTDVLRALAQVRGHRPIVVMLSNHAGSELRAMCRNLGADYFFDKALEFGNACDLIERIAAQRRSERQHGS